MKGKNRKWLLGTTIILIIAAISFLIYYSHRPEKNNIVSHLNYPFRKDGNLSFIATKPADTLAKIEIEIASTEDEIMRGLMDRDSLGMNRGMLFVFQNEDQRTFWMKDTRIPLDILFIGSDKIIKYITNHTTPYSTNPIPGFYPAKYVLEVNAGFCNAHGITPGVLIDF